MTTGTPFDRHERGALAVSGGKDSLALVYLLRPYWDRLTLYHVDAGDLLPEVREIVDHVAGMVPDFRRIETNAAAWSAVAGLPSDLVPTSSTQAGMAMGMSRQRIVDRMDCCAANRMLPMHERMLADGVTLAIRGTKRADLPRLPAVSGDTSLGYELWLPLQEWSHAEVFEYLRSVDAPICRVYEHQVNAPECACCPAWWSEGRAAYLSRYHPELYEKYQARLALVAAEVVPHWQTLLKEMSDGRFPTPHYGDPAAASG
jgi:phosphoadenosine phosphosulfate reductase